MDRARRLWITWERQRRNQTLSAELDAELHELIVDVPRFVKYPVLILRTLILVLRKRPSVLFVQNPSIVLSFFAIFYARLVGARLVVDEHNAGLFPLEGTSRLLNEIARFIVRRADYVIVTNSNLLHTVVLWGGRGLVLPDPLPEFSLLGSNVAHFDIYKVTFICTWSADEPYREVIEAASELGKGFQIFITGRYHGKTSGISIPDNVVLTGFLSEQDYVSTLASNDAVMVLTTRDDCLNCGAYEAISIEKPLVLSDTKALKEYFRFGVLFTANTSADIVRTVRALKENHLRHIEQIKDLKRVLSAEWAGMRERVNRSLADNLAER